MSKKLLIIGIDPGTTSAYAVLDIDGNILAMHSAKEMGMSGMISGILPHGKVLIVGCDKRNPPGFVEKFASQFRARLVHPEEDLGLDEKRQIVGDADFSNSHESDALASALYAYREYRPLFSKIDNFVERNGCAEIRDRITEMVVQDEISIKLACDMIQKPVNQEIRLIREMISIPLDEERRKLRNSELSVLYEKLKSHDRTIQNLAQQNRKLKKDLDSARKSLDLARARTFEKIHERSKEIAGFSKKQVEVQKRIMLAGERELGRLRAEISSLRTAIFRLNDHVLLKRIKSLGWADYAYVEKYLNISEGDIILVDNVSVASDKTFERLIGKVTYILYRGKLPRSCAGRPFAFVNVSDAKIELHNDFALIKNSLFRELAKNTDILERVIESYQKENVI